LLLVTSIAKTWLLGAELITFLAVPGQHASNSCQEKGGTHEGI
jgi:hypothetical protein